MIEMNEAQLKKLAASVRIELPQEHIDSFCTSLNEILHYFRRLDNIVLPESLGDAELHDETNPVREDDIKPSLDAATVFNLAPHRFQRSERLFRLQGVFEDIER